MLSFLKRKNNIALTFLCFWYLALFPGRLGFDSAEAIRMIQRGESTDWWGASFFWFLRISTLSGTTIAISSLIQLVFLYQGLRIYIESLPISPSVKQKTLAIVVFTPFFGFFGAGISHDVFLVTGILLILSEENKRLFNVEGSRSISSQVLFNSVLIFSLSTTKIGLVIFFMYCLFQFLRDKKIKSIALLVAGISLYFVSLIGISPQASGYYLWPAFADLKCIAQHSSADITTSQWNWLSSFAPKESWKNKVSCSSMDQAVESLGFKSNVDIPFSSEFLKQYLEISAQNPAIVVMAHINRARVALPPPFFPIPLNQVDLNSNVPIGLGTNTALQSGPEVLHPSIDEISMKVNTGPLKILEMVVQIPTFLINQASWFWGWGGMWLWAIGFFYLRKAKSARIFSLLIVNWPILVLHAILVALAPTSLPRYVMTTIYCGLIALTAYLVEQNSARKSE